MRLRSEVGVKDRAAAANVAGHKVTRTRADSLIFRGAIHAPHCGG